MSHCRLIPQFDFDEFRKPMEFFGYEVISFVKQRQEAYEMCYRLFKGRWLRAYMKGELGGLVLSEEDGAYVWVSLRAEPVGLPSIPDGMYEVDYYPALRRWITPNRDRILMAIVARALVHKGIRPSY